MENKALLGGIIGVILGGLIVATISIITMQSERSMGSLDTQKGDAFDEAFIATMIEHHQGAVDMAKLAEKNAKHDEIKNLSKQIINTQQKEINQLKMWQQEWGYETSSDTSGSHMDMGH